MKKCVCALLLGLILSGCTAEETFETIADELLLPVMAQPRHISVELPGETALPVIENDNGRVYVCNDYEIVLQTLEAGDLAETMQTLSGLPQSSLTIMETQTNGMHRHEFVWAAAGETGDQSGRGVVLNDGTYHYCMTVLRRTDGDQKSQINWDQVFSSFCVV